MFGIVLRNKEAVSFNVLMLVAASEGLPVRAGGAGPPRAGASILFGGKFHTSLPTVVLYCTGNFLPPHESLLNKMFLKTFFIQKRAWLAICGWFLLPYQLSAQSTSATVLPRALDSQILEQSEFVRVKYVLVFFITNRKIDRTAEDIARKNKSLLRYEELFLNSRTANLSYGWLDMGYPANHKPGQPNYEMNISAQNPYRHFAINDHRLVDTFDEFRFIVERLAPKNGRSFVYVHGMNNNFKLSAEQLTQLSVDLEVKGTPFMFSWPSDGPPLPIDFRLLSNASKQYREAAKNLAESRLQLEEAMKALAASSAPPFDVLAHSMGADLASYNLAFHRPPRSPDAPYLILAAADISTQHFASHLRNGVIDSTNHLRAYCANDGALAASSRLNGSDERLGFCAGPKTKMQGVEFVAVRGVSKDFGNHSYYLHAREVVDDIKSLLVNRQPSYEHRTITVR